MAKGEISSLRDVAMNLADPTTITHKEVQYRIDGQVPYALYIPVADYSSKRVQELVLQKVKEWGEVVGKALESK